MLDNTLCQDASASGASNFGGIKIIHRPSSEDPFCVIWKDCGVPSSPLGANERCAINMAVAALPVLCQAEGKEHGLIHRLDTDTRGLLLIASTKESYNALLAAQNSGLFKKTYRAKVQYTIDNAKTLGGFPPPPFLPPAWHNQNDAHFRRRIASRFRPYKEGRKQVRPVTDDSSEKAQKAATKRVYCTDIESVCNGYAACSITAGFRHQVRCHLSWIGLPIAGDRLYNSNLQRGVCGAPMQFECISLSFPHPITGEIITISAPNAQ